MLELKLRICGDAKIYNQVDELEDRNDHVNVSDLSDVIKYVYDNNIDINNCSVEIESIDQNCQQKDIDSIISYFDNVYLNLPEFLSIGSTKDYLDKYPYLKKYNVVIPGSNYHSISYDQLLEIDEYITKITNYVKRFNLSPFEQTIFVADLVRELKYKGPENEDDPSISRDLIEIIHNDYIVCAGYANIYKAVLDKLGITCAIKTYYHEDVTNIAEEDRNRAHDICEVLINDDKHDIHGPFAYDITGSATTDSVDLLKDYTLIAIPIELDQKIKYFRKHYDAFSETITNSKARIETNIARAIKMCEMAPILIETNYNMVKRGIEKLNEYRIVQSIDEYAIEKGIEISKLEPVQKIYFLKDYYLNNIKSVIYEIPKSTFFKALYGVKRIEQSINNDKYGLYSDDMIQIIQDREKFLKSVRTAEKAEDIGIKPLSDEERLLQAIFGNEDPEIDQAREELEESLKPFFHFENYGDDELDTAFERDQEMMRILSVIRKATGENTENPVQKERKLK